MIKGVIIKKLNKFKDDRGWLAEIFRNDEIDFSPAMSYVSVTKPGVIRGPHEHVEQSDCFVFVGPGSFELHLWDRQKGRRDSGISPSEDEYMKLKVGENNPTMVIVPPGVVHGYKCISDCDGWCINLPDKLFKGGNKKKEVDEIRWENRDNSPYKIE
ncbi:dTDP-4-dehydrorhamnose 3,5-epimerase family protein [Candidatus Parcubacteria bacterium]|nr:dTDP-4-dehydrorhamnose 3,5-epimerase family protein [Candidatus Parcubacteria bacterium]